MNKYLIGCLILVYSTASFSSGMELDKRIDSRLDKQLNQSDLVVVNVLLEDVSNAPIKGSKRELNEIFQQRSAAFKKSEEDQLALLNSSDFQVRYKFNSINGFSGLATRSGIEKLLKNPLVKYIEVDRPFYPTLSQSVPITHAVQNQDLFIGGQGQTVCVIDSGINYTHPDLGGCIGSNCKVLGGYDFYYNTTDVMDHYGHGTHVAGIVAANGTVFGVAPYAHLVALKVASDTGDYRLEKIEPAIDWCISHRNDYNISVITISIADNEKYLGDDCMNESTLAAWIKTAINYGIVVDASSGNMGWNGNMSAPACIGGVISVGATYDANFSYVETPLANCSMNGVKVDNITCFTNRNQYLDLVAPGDQIISTWYNGSGYSAQAGTSMAAPHVAGAAAILKQINSSLTPSQIQNILYTTGTPTVDYSLSRNNEPGSGLTFRRIDVFEAVASISFSKVLTVSNTGVGLLNVTNATGSASWIYKIDPKNFTLAVNQSMNVTFTVDPRGMDSGVYPSSVTLVSNDPDQGNYTLPVVMRIWSEGCGGGGPPGSGDWNITSDKYCGLTDVYVAAGLNIQNEAKYTVSALNLSVDSVVQVDGAIVLDDAKLTFR
jgi:subtilisin family serine protease